jgi:hypothetical protein
MNFEPLLAGPLHPVIAEVARYFQTLAPGDALPKRHDFRPNHVRHALGYIFLVDVLPGDYRWDLVGEKVGILFGTNRQDTHLSTMHPIELRNLLKPMYDGIVASRAFHYCRGRYTWPNRSVPIERLLVPMTDDQGQVTSIFGVTIPTLPLDDFVIVFTGDGAAGFEIDEAIAGAAMAREPV